MIEDPDGPDWWTSQEKTSTCSEECVAKCEKKAKETDVGEEVDDVKEFFDRNVEYF